MMDLKHMIKIEPQGIWSIEWNLFLMNTNINLIWFLSKVGTFDDSSIDTTD